MILSRLPQLLIPALAPLLLLQAYSSAADWPAWRGPSGTGITEEKDLPIKWSPTENVKWRIHLSEPGNSTPIVWKDRIFLTQPDKDRRTVLCLDRATGKVLWEEGIVTGEKEPTHGTNPYCSSSPVTDGERVIAFFASDGLFCYDLKGAELWRRTDLGKQIHIWGAGTSPVIHGDLCILNFGPGETTYLLAVNKKTGKNIWRKDEATAYNQPAPNAPPPPAGAQPKRETYIGSWTTPVTMKVDGRDQLLVSWPRRLAAYDPVKGDELWTCAGLNPLVYTSPIYEQGSGTIVTMGGFNGSAFAVTAGGSGDVTSSRRLWRHEKSPQRIGSGVIHEGHIFVHNDPGTAMCLNLKTGEQVWNERLSGKGTTNWSSVLLSGDKCYTINQAGDCFVFRASPKFELLATNSLGERSNSSIVPSNGELFIRTHKALWCIAEKK